MTKRGVTRSSSYRSSRGGRTRQSSVRASRRSKTGSISKVHSPLGAKLSPQLDRRRSKTGSISRVHSPLGAKLSPQLDRHPSVRYSIRRRRDGSKTSMDRDSIEASLLAEVIAADAVAARRDSGVVGGGSGDEVERELGRVISVLDKLHATNSRST